MNSIKIIEANLLDFPNNINSIAHSCNTRNIMGGGIAKQIKDRYPEAYEADTKAFNTEYDKDGQYVHWLGKFSKAEITNNNPFYPFEETGYIYNMYTQASIGKGREVNYEKFWLALKRVEQDLIKRKVSEERKYLRDKWGVAGRQITKEEIQKEKETLKHEYNPPPPPILGLPYGISCGLAGGNWGIIKAMIEDVFIDSSIETYIVKYNE